MDIKKELMILDYRPPDCVIQIGNWDYNGFGTRCISLNEIKDASQGCVFKDDYTPKVYDMGWEVLRILAKGENYAICEKERKKEISNNGQSVTDEVIKTSEYYLVKW